MRRLSPGGIRDASGSLPGVPSTFAFRPRYKRPKK